MRQRAWLTRGLPSLQRNLLAAEPRPRDQLASPPSSVAPQRPSVRSTWPSRQLLGAVIISLVFALAARLPYFAGSDFPLNDGGMFVAMARDLLQAHFALPRLTSYNLEAVPFAYPPVAFYLMAASSAATGSDPIGLARSLPLLANLATVLAGLALAWSILETRTALLGTVIFALIPRSYEWLIMGGGLTRSFGFLFALACLVVARQLFARPTLWRLAGCAMLATLALATHLEMGVFVSYSLGLLALAYGQPRWRALALTVLVGVVMLVLSAPWWALVIARDGLGPFQAASHTGEWTSLVEQLQGLEDFITPPKLLLSMPGTLAVIGVLVCLMRGQPFLPLWLPLIFLLNPRSAPTEAALPVGLLAAVGLTAVVGPGLALASRHSHGRWFQRLSSATRRTWQSSRLSHAITPASLGLAVLGVALSWPAIHPNRHALDVLSPADREAMGWISQQTDPTNQFLVLTRGWTWEDDHVSEWFPVLTGRHSVLTVQATEWLPDNAFGRTHCLYNQVRELGSLEWGVDRLDQWASDRGVVFSDVYISESVVGSLDWRPLIESARASSNYSVRYDADGVTLLERRQPIQPRWPASGPLLVADDCTSLSEQPGDTQQAMDAAFGQLAGRAWVDAHNQAQNQGLTPFERLLQLLIGTTPRPA